MNLLRVVFVVLLCLGTALGMPRRFCGVSVVRAVNTYCNAVENCQPLPDMFAYQACSTGFTKEELSTFCCPEY